MVVIKGKSKDLLEKAKESCLLAVNIYNKPKTSFKTEPFIFLMNITWTLLFHAIPHYNHVNYYYRKKEILGNPNV